MIRMYRYSGTGNNFLAVDGRDADIPRFRQAASIHTLCLIHGTDGILILDKSKKADFRMEYYNADGSSGMMCGNGGRCIVAFADLLGVKPFHSRNYIFEGPDGIHKANILSHLGESKIVRLGMNDVTEVKEMKGGFFLNTGAPHFVKFCDETERLDIQKEAEIFRWDESFGPQGTNVDFVHRAKDGRVNVRTFEKGVERETLSCGTGAVASAIASYCRETLGTKQDGEACVPKTLEYTIITRQDKLKVEFSPKWKNSFTNVFLTGQTICEGALE